MARRKQAALDVPATEAEARALMAEYVDCEREALAVRLRAEAATSMIVRARDERLAELTSGQDTRFRALKAWWEAGGQELGGKGRSAEFGGARIGIRLTPPKVKFARGVKAEDVIAWLKRLRWSNARDFLRTKVELDKQAVIRSVQSDSRIAARFEGQLSVVQTDEFFIDAGLDEDAMRKAVAAE